MGLFKKKKDLSADELEALRVKAENKKVSAEALNVETSVLDAPLAENSSEDKKPGLTEDEAALKELILAYSKYSGVFSPNDLANMSGPVVRTEDFTLKFAIFAELNKLNRLITDLK